MWHSHNSSTTPPDRRYLRAFLQSTKTGSACFCFRVSWKWNPSFGQYTDFANFFRRMAMVSAKFSFVWADTYKHHSGKHIRAAIQDNGNFFSDLQHVTSRSQHLLQGDLVKLSLTCYLCCKTHGQTCSWSAGHSDRTKHFSLRLPRAVLPALTLKSTSIQSHVEHLYS